MATSKPPQDVGLVAEIRRLLGSDIEAFPSPKTRPAFALGDPVEAVVRVQSGVVEVCLPKVCWTTPHTPETSAKVIVKIEWERLPTARASALLAEGVAAVRQMRLSTFKTCRLCLAPKPPEWMHDETVCQGCAEKHLGVVH